MARDLVCVDTLYEAPGAGKKMKDWLLCESTSTAYNSPTDNDVYWFLCVSLLFLSRLNKRETIRRRIIAILQAREGVLAWNKHMSMNIANTYFERQST